MRFRRPDGGVLQIGPVVVECFSRYRQLPTDAPEAGGILLGRLIRDSHDVVLDEATEPSRLDQRTRFSFFRARQPAQKRINQAWCESSQTLNYLGEWHTHPEDDPLPSQLDRRDWLRTLDQAQFEQDFLFFVIVGRISIRAWEASRLSRSLGFLQQL